MCLGKYPGNGGKAGKKLRIGKKNTSFIILLEDSILM
jgi:hypothetical protein